MSISLRSPRGQEQPSTLQWDLTIPAQLSLIDDKLQLGPEAKAASKSVTCRVKTKTDTAQTSICLVFGGREPVHDGVLAVLRLKISLDAKPGPAQIRIDEAVAVLKDLKRIPMGPVETVVRIREK